MDGPFSDPNLASKLAKRGPSLLPLKKRMQFLNDMNDFMMSDIQNDQRQSNPSISSTDSNLNETAMPSDLPSNFGDNAMTNESVVPSSEQDTVSTEQVRCYL